MSRAKKLFGTDGIRGVANDLLTPELALSLGLAAGAYMREIGASPRAVIGRDTRRSGPMLGAALASGLCSAGIEVITLGVAPTPTVAFAARTGQFGLGAIISASHNPAPDNGIKFVGHDGRKLPDEAEQRIEKLLKKKGERNTGAGVGHLSASEPEIERYLEFLESLLPERLDGMRVAVDAAHGAAFALAPEVLRRLGADVSVIGDKPDGMNINAEGGATKPDPIQKWTVHSRADIGVAFDGDADRAVFSDELGNLINGDRMMGIWALSHRRNGGLEPPLIIGTVMTNGGFEAFLRDHGIDLVRTPVGDKHVSQAIDQHRALIGGEQSGHIIFSRRGPTGDGLVTMLELLRVLKMERKPASALAALYEPWPQVLVNVAVPEPKAWDAKPAVASALAGAEARLGDSGRVVVRASGTQPMVRVMVEARDAALRDEVSNAIVASMERELGGKVYSRVELTNALGD